MIAVTMPGKTGDALFILPATRLLCQQYGCQADFYTSSHVERARDLFEYQSCINQMVVPKDYVIKRYDMGIQPWNIPVPISNYQCVFHMGYRSIPNCRLDHFMAKSIGLNPANLPKIEYDYPCFHFRLPKKFYVLAGNGDTSFRSTFVEFTTISDLPVVQIGLPHHFLPEAKAKNYTNLSFLESLYLISKSSGFVGLQTNQLVLANGFDIPKVAPHDGIHWDMRHVVQSKSNFYPIDPLPEQILELLHG